jgi:hypothetical protein
LPKKYVSAKLILDGESDYYPGGVRQGATSFPEAPRISMILPDSLDCRSPWGDGRGDIFLLELP